MDSHKMTPPKQNSQGRPRSSDVDKRIIDATLTLLSEIGVEKISIESIAAKAKVGKSSIYRRWNNKDDLIIEALGYLKPEMNMPAHGELDQVLYELSQNFSKQMNNPLGKQMLSLLISTLSSNSQIAETYWENHSLPKTKEISKILLEYSGQDQLRDDTDLDLVSELLIGFIIYQLLLKPTTRDMESSLKAGIDMVLNGIKAN
ncbi:TetR/AcrR family transcriptional regulator [Halalkalibacter sp. APA_J-10(15)]|uniref:TetR/AcrR family transcriptional regulator n=1 Tax=Halalkalibacter sp. APA_J-10(15) TaxID=2933805 RepID=UPI001FF2644A|nr:TetR/AcrR family transcriptional regulator [Halalkalibacter sp. APA_J-10(15)]MCK0469819.1 TetR/AcrR family transcriptional regulator [Halalkalibacter sp. APA_J-10(15)]